MRGFPLFPVSFLVCSFLCCGALPGQTNLPTVFATGQGRASVTPNGPARRLLLTARRLRRLNLDAERRTDRWVNFENRVLNVADSPERGFELALYGAVKTDANACKQAAAWAVAHPQSTRQVLLVADWCGDVLSSQEVQRLASLPVTQRDKDPFAAARDWAFQAVVTGTLTRTAAADRWSHLLPLLQADPVKYLPDAYALYEFLDTVEKNTRLDLRREDVPLFNLLPSLFLHWLKPAEIDQPDWQTRIAGLMMVNVDSNLQGSGFIQGWAIEDPKMVQNGPGVAYELLWANPYLPGLGFHNMDAWVYDSRSATLLARTSWDADACWIEIRNGVTSFDGCPGNKAPDPPVFGTLRLRKMDARCIEIDPTPVRFTLLEGLPPGAPLTWNGEQKPDKTTKDKVDITPNRAGMLLLSPLSPGKLCR